MAVDATGTPTPLGIPKFNVNVDPPSGNGTNAMMDSIDALITARVAKPSGIVSSEVPVWNGSTWVRSSTLPIGPASLGSGTPDATKFLRGDGSWQVVGAGSLLGMQVLSGSGTYTPTANTTRIFVECVGGGASSGGTATASGNSATSSPGGGGAYAASLLTSGFSGAAYSVGAGGAAPAANSNGNNGNDTTWASTVIVAKGGFGGLTVAANTWVAAGGGGQAGSCTGQIKISGSGGHEMQEINNFAAGNGGHSGKGFGAGGRGQVASTGVGEAGQAYGGGGGGSTTNGTAQAGAAGAAGTIIVWEFA